MQIGEVVYLKSGSPKLTVIREANLLNGTKQLTVTWLNENGDWDQMSAPDACFTYEDPGLVAER